MSNAVRIHVPSSEEIREIAKAAYVHARSVERRLLGLEVKGVERTARIDAELKKRGYKGA